MQNRTAQALADVVGKMDTLTSKSAEATYRLPSTTSTRLTIASDKKGRAKLASALDVLQAGQKAYGRKPEDAGVVLKLFAFVLADFEADEIVNALRAWASFSSEFPTPAEIAQVIARGNRPPVKTPIYIELCRQRDRGEFMSSDEKRYIRDYESLAIKGAI